MESKRENQREKSLSKREENRLKMEQHIYDVAIDLFCECGYQQTTLSDIAAQAEVSSRTLYKYFPTKISILLKFTRENIMGVRAFASQLPEDMPLKEKIIEVMVQDYKFMFCLFDVSYILFTSRDENGTLACFEFENILVSEGIFSTLIKQEQLRIGVQPNNAGMLYGSVIMALARHCNDLYRYEHNCVFDEEELRKYYRLHLDSIWDSLYEHISCGDAGEVKDEDVERLKLNISDEKFLKEATHWSK